MKSLKKMPLRMVIGIHIYLNILKLMSRSVMNDKHLQIVMPFNVFLLRSILNGLRVSTCV